MNYRLAIEDIEPGHWLAWALDLPDCTARGDNATAAVLAAPAAITAYLTWVAGHDPTLAVATDDIAVTVVDSFAARPASATPSYLINACFDDDYRPLTVWDLAHARRLLAWTAADLLGVVAEGVEAEADAILRHVATAENGYFNMFRLGSDALPEDPLARLRAVLDASGTRLRSLAGNEWIVVESEEVWTARKIVRRALWHRRDHTAQLAELRGGPAGAR